MKKYLLLGAALTLPLLPACCSAVNSAKTSASPPHENLPEHLVQTSVALVHFVNDDKEVAEDSPDVNKAQLLPYCTGVWVSKDTFLTAEHCVDDIGRPEQTAQDLVQQLLDMLTGEVPEPAPKTGADAAWTPIHQPVLYSVRGDITPNTKLYHRGEVTAVDMGADLVLVQDKGASPKHPIATLSEAPIRVGESMHIVGQTAQMWWCYMRGYVSAELDEFHTTKDTTVKGIMVQAPVYFGDSGGGLFNESGELVGMADEIAAKVPSVAYYVHRDELRKFLVHNQVIPATSRHDDSM